jgi:hypothetical protein
LEDLEEDGKINNKLEHNEVVVRMGRGGSVTIVPIGGL